MQKIYLVTTGARDEWHINSVFLNKEKAHEHLAKLKEHDDTADIEEHDISDYDV